MVQAGAFGKDFAWGVAISALQNEGACETGGRGPSIWDIFAKRPGKIKRGARPTTACEFYHRYKDDLELVSFMGFNTFRFSLSWSCILPDGTGRPHPDGISYYNNLIDACLSKGITPYVTLYHWDLPQALEREGGWASFQMERWFGRYATICASAFGDRVKHWIILNEPMGFTSLGYMLGKHAPGKRDAGLFITAVHQAALAQADGGRIIRSLVSGAQIGTSFSCSEVMPFSESTADRAAAERLDILLNRLFPEPALGQGFPQASGFPLLEKMFVRNKAWKYTGRYRFDFDFIGIQNYFSLTVKHNPFIPYVSASEVKASSRGVPHTALGWEINPDSFGRMLKRYWKYGSVRSIIVTESGACFRDQLQKGVVNDAGRIAYFEAYLQALLKAIRSGIRVDGYFVWTLTDNFEWSEGFDARFGLVHVHFPTQRRTFKQSGYWWRDFLNPL